VSRPLVSFDGTERSRGDLLTPADREEARALLDTHPRLAIRGSGLSYCQAGAAESLPSMSTRRLDRIIALDRGAKTVCVEAGLTIGRLLRHLVGEGFWFPVLPGHPEITVGGCTAFNTHGKTQHDIGQFSDHVVELTLLHHDHGELTCSPTERPELFWLTIGGMGLTGWIADVTLRVERLRGPMIERRAHRARDFIEAVEIMESHDTDEVHLYSWNDANRRGGRFGRGVVFAERFVEGSRPARTTYRALRSERRGRLLPFSMWNRATTSVANRAYFRVEGRRSPRVMPALDAAFPINGKEGYFHAFGRPGLREYQLIIPRDDWADAIENIRGLIASTGVCVTLASLKLFRGEPRHLWFRGDGVCLTIDGPANDRTRQLFAELDRLAIDIGAPVNLSKDSRLDEAAAAAIFPGYATFRRELRAFDPTGRIDSELRRRINV
jgi:decaprenylphospho-beta-D-ribofuranose 2-oxidase